VAARCTGRRKRLTLTRFPFALLQRGAPVEAVTHCAFDPAEECVWAGTDGGSLAVFALPELARYCCVGGAHAQPLAALLPLGGAAFSASARQLRVHSSGGVLRLAVDEDGEGEQAAVLCAAFESPAAPRVVLGRDAPFLQTFDLATGRYGPRVDAPDGACVVASGGRALAFGSANGARTPDQTQPHAHARPCPQGACRCATRERACARRRPCRRTPAACSAWTRAPTCSSPPASPRAAAAGGATPPRRR